MYLYFNNFGISLLPLGVLILAIVIVICWKQGKSLSYLLFLSFFGVYLLLGIDKVFFPLEVSGPYVDEMRQMPMLVFINIRPVFLALDDVSSALVKQLVSNVILTLPFGFGLNFLTRVGTRKIFVISIALGVGLEMAQLFLSLILRYPYRVIDINDALCNTVGVLLGYGLFKLFVHFYLALTEDFEGEKRGLMLYLDNVTHQTEKLKSGD